MVSQQSFFPGELLLQTLFRNRYFIVKKDFLLFAMNRTPSQTGG